MEQIDLRNELANEPVSEDEVRQLIERFTFAEFGDKPTTIEAVAEATGESIEKVAGLLASLRADSDPTLRQRVDRLEEVVEEHDTKIQAALARPRTRSPRPIVGPYGQKYFKSGMDDMTTMILVVVFIVFIIGLLMAFSESSTTNEPKCYSGGVEVDCRMFPHISQ